MRAHAPRWHQIAAARRLELIRAERVAAQGSTVVTAPLAPLPPFLDWIQKASPRYDKPTHLAPLCALIDDVRAGKQVRAVVHAPPRHWKAIRDDTPMLTARGWITVGEVVVGDRLVGSNGNWTTVTGVFPQGEVDLFSVKFSDGSGLITCAEHRWLVCQRYYPDHVVIRTTGQLRDDLREGDGRKKWRIPIVSPLLGEATEFVLDPYLLGLWLGDGTSSRAEITTADIDVIDAFRTAGLRTSYAYKTSAATTYGIPGRLWSTLRRLNLIRNKHVPKAYLHGPIAARLAVLQGLADTDGHAQLDGSLQNICTTSERLAADIKFLINSLGGVWTEFTRPAAQKIEHIIAVRLPIGMSLFRLHRKASRMADQGPRNKPRRFVSSIEPTARGTATCFTVDADDHLFAAGRALILTHNTETVLHAPAYLMQEDPTFITGYVTYEQSLSEEKSHIARSISLENGIILERSRLEGWINKDRGGFIATSFGSPFTGKGVRLLIIDDYFKDRASAESALGRKKQWDWWSSVALLRLEPNASIIVLGTRWHTKDLGGQLLDLGWQYIRLPAVDDADAWEHFDDPNLVARMTSLLPHRHPPSSFVQKKRDGLMEYDWVALFQGLPRQRGGNVFGDPSTYREVPKWGTFAIGIDCAYSKKTKSDWSVAVVLKKCERFVDAKAAVDEDNRPVFDYFVVEVVRKQCKSSEFKLHLRAVHERYPNARIQFRGAGIEEGVADLFRTGNELGSRVPVEFRATNVDKFTRAQSYATAWGKGRVHVPEQAEWQAAFVSEHADFTGLDDDKDDQVDAGATAFDLLATSGPAYGDNRPVVTRWGRGR